MPIDFSQGVTKASESIQAYTYPLLRVDENVFPDLVASCVFIEISGSVYLITAAHAIRGHKHGLLTRGRGHLIDVSGRATVSRAQGVDHFDIAAVYIDEKIIREHGISVIRESMFSSGVEVENPHSRAICGFPVSMNKQTRALDRSTKTFSAKSYTYFGSPICNVDFAAFDKSPDRDVGLNYLPGTDDAGRVMSSPPSPRGISGGGAWLVPDFSRPSLLFLEGIVIECHKKAKNMFIFSTRLEHVVDFVYQSHTLAT